MSAAWSYFSNFILGSERGGFDQLVSSLGVTAAVRSRWVSRISTSPAQGHPGLCAASLRPAGNTGSPGKAWCALHTNRYAFFPWKAGLLVTWLALTSRIAERYPSSSEPLLLPDVGILFLNPHDRIQGLNSVSVHRPICHQ